MIKHYMYMHNACLKINMQNFCPLDALNCTVYKYIHIQKMYQIYAFTPRKFFLIFKS